MHMIQCLPAIKSGIVSHFSKNSLLFFSFQFYQDIIDIQHCISLGCTAEWFDLHTSWSKFSEYSSFQIDIRLKKEKKFFSCDKNSGFTLLTPLLYNSSVNYIQNVLHG